MQQNYLNNYPNTACTNPNAVSINIYSPQAYGNNPTCQNYSNEGNNGFYSMYGTNTMPNMPLYPQNYNAPINYNYMTNPQTQNYPYRPGYPMPINPNSQEPSNKINPNNQANMLSDNNSSSHNKINEDNSSSKTDESSSSKKDEKKDKEKVITPLTDDYIKNLENYMNSSNSKIRLIGMKEIMERFKEDENRKDNKSLIPLLNKALQDTNSAIRFLALTTLQLGYSVGDDTTVKLLTKIANENQDKFGQDALLASEILLKLSAPQPVTVKENK